MYLKEENISFTQLVRNPFVLLKADYLRCFLQKYAFISYLVVGVISTMIYFVSFALLWQLMGINYKLSVSIAYFSSVLFHFFANRRFTFKASEANFFKQVVKYISVIIINYFVTLLVMHFFVEILHVSPYYGVCVSIIANINTNFLMFRYWVFRVKKFA